MKTLNLIGDVSVAIWFALFLAFCVQRVLG